MTAHISNPVEFLDLASRVDDLAGASVQTVGDLMLDRFIYGHVERISPEGPIPVLKIDRQVSMLGGSGNVLRNLAAVGASAAFIAVVGDDMVGEEVGQLVQKETGGAALDLIVEAGRLTTIKERYVASNQQLLRADREMDLPLTADTRSQLVARVRERLGTTPVLILSDYGKGVLTPETLKEIIAIGVAAGCQIIADPKGRDYSVYKGVTVVTPNRRELQEATGMSVAGDDAVVAACQQLIKSCGIKAVLATRSEEGMTLVTEAGVVEHFAAEAREVFDVSGAGDTVVAVLGAALAAGLGMKEAACLANVAAGIVVGKTGTAVAYGSEIRQALLARNGLSSKGKIAELDTVLHRVGQWRKAGYKIGFTNGCFDLLHPGHISILRQARASCDRLIVGLNTDASIKRLKGESRPIQNEDARAVVLSAIESVNQVILFGEDTPLALIEAILPDVLVKGADYSVDQVVGGDVVIRNGGEVVLAKLEDGFSTTGTVAKIQENQK
ncbi:D-glycero-beta-D-manno-heptose 1-phosphate adenylyltransferase [Kiloniella laminariae]|uniref:Bifunctional protein HldE n=1 Tax=Kiloniella laminariae TaxID=454162 RepID=A0ABT4LIM0_9PROT|nr:D-glycero-beta-D-manno-heptose 1-phosphate adenylyltransferase [Kiloniella laminariae]MCZ4280953.1 D-glycero-beta-D-manno-heptose 1-phosphate adenylyltransferase [Kiloniella laminariae]